MQNCHLLQEEYHNVPGTTWNWKLQAAQIIEAFTVTIWIEKKKKKSHQSGDARLNIWINDSMFQAKNYIICRMPSNMITNNH